MRKPEKLVVIDGPEAGDAIIHMAMAKAGICPTCGARKARKDDRKPFTREDLVKVGFAVMVIAFFGAMGFGANFFLSVFIAMIAYVAAYMGADAIDRHLGLK